MPALDPPLAPAAFAGFDTWPLAFGRDGQALDVAQVQAALQALPQATDLLVIAHGWNNDIEEAAALYRGWLTQLGAQRGAANGADPRHVIVWRLHWPSKRFADADLVPGGGDNAAEPLAAEAGWAHLALQIDRALADLDPGIGPDTGPNSGPSGGLDGGLGTVPARAPAQAAALRAMKALLPRLDEDTGAQDDFTRLARVLLAPEMDDEEAVLPDSFHSMPGPALLQRLGQRFRPRQPAGGGAAVLQPDDADGGGLAAGGAAFLGNLFEGVANGAQNLLNLFTYYQMKQRAGEVGRRGLAPLLTEAQARRPGLRLHLAGHSFGARLVTAALAARPAPASPADGARSLLLLQAAFSHNAFARAFDGQQDGHFRAVLTSRLNGPLVVSHTARDRAVGLAYPIASRLRQQVASGLGDENDPYGALGRNGALWVGDALDRAEPRLRPVGEAYAPFQPRRVYNLQGGDFIRGHGDVEGPEVAQAWWHALQASP